MYPALSAIRIARAIKSGGINLKQLTRQARRTFLRIALIGGSALLAVYLLGCDGGGEAPAATPTPIPSGPHHKELVTAWFDDREVQYYDFGSNNILDPDGSVARSSVWWFIHGVSVSGDLDYVEGQTNVIDGSPGEEGYSDLRQMFLVTVTDDYTPDTIRSKAAIDASGFTVAASDLYINCPIMPEGSTLAAGPELGKLWNRDKAVYCPDFGFSNPFPMPMWVFTTGTDSEGNPKYLEGQHNVISALEGNPEYSGFCRVNLVEVPDGYEANTIRSAAAIEDSGYPVTITDQIINCPMIPAP